MIMLWAAVAAISALVYLLSDQILNYLTPKGLKGIRTFADATPITGDLPKLASWIKNKHQLSSFFDHAAAQLGDICNIRIGFRVSSGFVVIGDFQEIEDILVRRTHEFDRAKDTINVFQPVMACAQIALRTNDMWKHHRRLVGPAMTSKYLSLTTPRANLAVAQLVELWRVKAARLGKGDAAGRCFEAQQDLEWATLDAICDIALGESWDCVQTATDQVNATSADPKSQEITDKGEVVFKVTPPALFTAVSYIFGSFPTLSPTPALSHFLTRCRPTYQKHHKALFSFLTKRFAASRTTAAGRGDTAGDVADSTLDLITARENKGNGDFMSDKEMRDELFQFLVAGAETTAVTLSWWVKYMAAHPEIQHNLRNYLRKTIPELDDRPPTYADVATDNLPYLEAVASETLRLSKTAGAVTREAMVDTEILGKRIPKGTTLLLAISRVATVDASTEVVSILDPSKKLSAPEAAAELDPLRSKSSRAAGRKVGFWAAGTGFDYNPDRWLNQDGSFNANAGPMLPFSSGQRGCFGKNLANLELKLFIAQLTLAFFFEPVPKGLDSYDGVEVVARHPEHGFVRPVAWSEVASQ